VASPPVWLPLSPGLPQPVDTRGYDQSAQDVYSQLKRAGYDVSYQPFVLAYFNELSDAELE